MRGSSRRRFQVDWLVSNLRWLLLVAVVAVGFLIPEHGFRSRLSTFFLAVVLLAALYNLAVTLLLVYGAYPRALSQVTLGIDAALAVGLVAVSGGFQSPFLFYGLLPIITAALRFSFVVSLVVALSITSGYFILGLTDQGNSSAAAMVARVGDAAVLLLAALVAGLIGQQMQRRIAQALQMEKAEELRQLRSRHQQSRLIFELASTLSATLNYQRVLEAMLDVSEIGLHELGLRSPTQVGVVLLYQEQELRVVACRHLTRRDQSVVLEGRHGVIAQALAAAEPVVSDNPGHDPELSRFVAMHRCRQAVAVPLRAGFENFGVVVFATPEADGYTADYHDLLVALCNQAVVALQNAQLYQSLMEEKERIVAVEEDARKKLARDLHDGPTQSIAAIAMRLNYVRSLVERGPKEVADELGRVEELARRTTKEIRHMLFTLRPLILETQGLRAALAQYIAKRAETNPTPVVRLDAPEGVDQALQKNVQGVIFYIIEEAISNARKHARATNICVRLSHEGSVFVCEVADDGSGFDLAEVMGDYSLRGSLGMTNMIERAELVGGRLDIQTAPGQGTRVVLTVELEEEGA
jgi:signal transduction histidine kinase